MLHVILGTDRKKVRAAVSNATARAKISPGWISDANPIGDLVAALQQGTSMFGDVRSVVLDGVFASEDMRPLLLDALKDLIPESIWRRPKMGFTLPFQDWLLTALRPQVESALDCADGLTAQGLSRRAVQSVWQAFVKNPQGEPWSRPWSLYVLDRWCALNHIEA